MTHQRADWMQALLLLLVVGTIRWFAISLASDAFRDDPDVYRKLAVGLAAHQTFGEPTNPTAFRPPLYPWMLSWFVDIDRLSLRQLGVQSLHTFLGTMTCLGVWWLFRSYIKNLRQSPLRRSDEWAACCASLLTAIDPILLRQSQLIMTETFATALAVLVLVALQLSETRPSWSTRWPLGIFMGLSILCRPTALVWLALLLAYEIWRSNVFIPTRCFADSQLKEKRNAFMNAAALIVGSLVVLVPWAIRNQQSLGKPIVATSHGGYTFYLANNDPLYDHLETNWGRDWDEDKFHALWVEQSKGQTELEQDSLASSLAWTCIANRPVMFAKSCLVRVGWFWSLWPNQSGMIAKIAIGVWYIVLFGFATFGLFRSIRWTRNRRLASPLTPGLLLVVSLVLVHSLFWSNMRMRSVAMPFVAILAVSALCLNPLKNEQR